MESISLEQIENPKTREFFYQGLEYLQKKSISNALERFEAAEDLLLKDLDLYFLSFVRLEKIKALKALKQYELAQRIIPTLVEYFSLHKMFHPLVLVLIEDGEIRSILQEHKQATEIFLQALDLAKYHQLDNFKAYIYSTLAESFAQQKLYNEAIAHLKKYSQFHTENSYDQAWVNKRLADLYWEILEYQGALPHYLKAQDLFLQNKDYTHATQCMESLLKIYQQTGEQRKSQDLQQKMIAINQLQILKN